MAHPDTHTAPSPSAATAVPVGEQFAAFLVASGQLAPDQLRLAARVHSKVKTTRTLTSVLVELKHVTADQIREALRSGQIQAPLGDVVVELGLVEPHELKLADAMQRDRPSTSLADILVDNHFVNERDLIGVLADQRGLASAALDGAALDVALLKRAPLAVYKTHQFVPLKREGERVVVAFVDPDSAPALEAARKYFGRDLVPGIVGRRAMASALDRAERELQSAAVPLTPEQGAVALVNKIIEDAMANRVSDIHFEPSRERLRVRFRQDGVMVPVTDVPLDQATSLIGRIKVMAGADIAERRRHQDGRIQFETARGTIDIRVSIYVTIHGEKVVMRLLNNRDTLLGVRDIGMAPRMLELLQRDALDVPSGVVIVTGPTGSGKTTTLYASVNYLNDAKTSIITAEDPVEYMIDGISQCSINSKINVGFAETLKAIVRQDPDVIVIGEIRDQFSAEVAINAALTGHKVLTTFHTEDSIGGLVRLLNMNIEAFLISSTVVSVVAQRLLRRVCHACAEDHVLTPHELARLGYAPLEAAGLTFKRGRGCPACRHSGYKGRVAVFEILVLNELVRDAVLSRRSAYEIRRVCIEASGLVTLAEDGIAKAAAGLTSFEEILRQLPRLTKPRPIGELRRLLGVTE
ncbi:MAG: type II/IV secretion system protein [Acidobacteria bacterium]|nr:type II/IV secretion system protein [Acidobacteriota bacterium]